MALFKEYKPLPYRDGNTVLKKYCVKFVDPVGNKADIIKVDYKTNKGKIVEGFTLHVVWDKYRNKWI